MQKCQGWAGNIWGMWQGNFFVPIRLRRWNRQSVPERWHIKFRRRGITQSNAHRLTVITLYHLRRKTFQAGHMSWHIYIPRVLLISCWFLLRFCFTWDCVRGGDILKSINSKPESEKPGTLKHAMKAQWKGGKGKAVQFLETLRCVEASSQRHAPPALPPGQCPIPAT
jgi:hypothetical protein